ncbi:hypothetical protein GCM10025868_16170 [Angustibacter aerolatus]|uniref:Uncharacterized protein n=1 Tax=Angustibacter aerolatus TaxID=1162965 RepID=A0ABQ6JDU9_9ACTN|nr:hypothetical protein GCM10025868_16170 [Angustibacter aerolatus]
MLPVVQKPLRADEVLVNLSMLQQPFGTPRVIGVDWTLWVEARFYLLFGLFVVWRGSPTAGSSASRCSGWWLRWSRTG